MKEKHITHPDITIGNLQGLLKQRITGKVGFKIATLIMVLNGELSIEEIARHLSVSRQFVYQLIWAVNENGLLEFRQKRK